MAEWPACRATSTIERPSAISSETNECRRSYGRTWAQPCFVGGRVEDATTPVLPVVVVPRIAFVCPEDEFLVVRAPVPHPQLRQLCLQRSDHADRACCPCLRALHLAVREGSLDEDRPIADIAPANGGDEVGVDPGIEVGELDAEATAELRGAELAVPDGAVDGVGREPGCLGDLADREQASIGQVQTFTCMSDATSLRESRSRTLTAH